ncbi:MAG: ATP-binding protein [Actinomycetota bacterium]
MIARLPLRLRLTLVFAASMAVLLAIVGTFLYVRLRAELTGTTDAALRAQSGVIAAGLDQNGGNFGDQTGASVNGVETFAQVIRRSGEIVDSSQALASPLLTRAELNEVHTPMFFDRAVPGVSGIARLLVSPAGDGSTASFVVVGTSLEADASVLSGFLAVLLIGGPMALAVASGLGWLIAGAALQPVERVRREAEAVSTSDLARRLPVPPSDDELARLVVTLNEMLARLQTSFDHERRFVDDASHELRTPLTNLKAEVDLSLTGARSATELAAALRSASTEIDRLAALASDLLIYSRADGGRVPLVRRRVRLDELVTESCAAHQRAAEAAGVRLLVDAAPLSVSVDEIRVRQAVDNLIDNAVRHTPAQGCVEVRADRAGDANVEVVVEDSGAGFAPGFLDAAFEPFARGEADRATGAPGAGLGLAIVRVIATAHGGSVSASNRVGGGARLALVLPSGS